MSDSDHWEWGDSEFFVPGSYGPILADFRHVLYLMYFWSFFLKNTLISYGYSSNIYIYNIIYNSIYIYTYVYIHIYICINTHISGRLCAFGLIGP